MKEIKETQEKEPTRQPRSLDSRSFDTRQAQERAPMVYQEVSRYNLPPSVNERYVNNQLGWVIYSANAEMNDNYYLAREEMWRPLLSSEDPELARIYGVDSYDDRGDQFIRRGMQILMIRDNVYKHQEDSKYDAIRKTQLDSIDAARVPMEGDANYHLDHRFPKTYQPIYRH